MILVFLFILLVGAVAAAVFSINALVNTLRFGLPFVTTPDWAIDWLKNNLPLTPSDIVYELGCGDARFLATMAKKHPTTSFIGIEIQWWPWLLAKIRTRKLHNVRIVLGDFLKHDLSRATVVYGFYITVMMPRVTAKLQKEMRPGTTVISFGFAMPGWQLVREILPPGGQRGSKIRIYKK